MKPDTIADINRKKPSYSVLTAIEFDGEVMRKSGPNTFRKCKLVSCLCICGNIKTFLAHNVIQGKPKCCGCLHKTNETHGLSRKHPLYRVWDGIKQRCYNPTHPAFRYWGGKGVVMCPEWRYDFKAFYDWGIANGWQQGLQIDKDIKAKELGVEPLLYSPERCQFVTPLENTRNRTCSVDIELNGVTRPIKEWADLLSIPIETIRGRLNKGLNAKDALNTNYNKKGQMKLKLSEKQKEVIKMMRDGIELWKLKRLHRENGFRFFKDDKPLNHIHYKVILFLEKHKILNTEWFIPCTLTELGKTISLD